MELYDLRADLSETRDLASTLPEKANELKAMLTRWREQVGAQMPLANPTYDAEKAKRNFLWLESLRLEGR